MVKSGLSFFKKKIIIFIFLNWWLFLKKYFVCGESRKVGDLGVCTVMMRVGSIDGSWMSSDWPTALLGKSLKRALKRAL